MASLFGTYHLGRFIRIILEGSDMIRMLFNEVLSSTLMYQNKKEESEKKKQYYSKVEKAIKKFNYNVRVINNWKNKNFPFLQKDNVSMIDLSAVKHIIYQHKGQYDSSRLLTLADLTSTTFTVESLSKKNTLFLLQDTLRPVYQSISEFEKNLDKIFTIFGGKSYEFKTRNKIKRYLNEAREVYSFGHFGNAAFLVGKALEASIADYVLVLKSKGKIDATINDISEWDFEKKINQLRKFITPSQCAKMLSVKWDRNVLGHASRRIELTQAQKDADAIIKIGINLIEPIESKMLKPRKNKK